jgi:signal transduction histidine kinase
MALPIQPDVAAQHLKLARRMSQHSLTEARRSIFDLRAGTQDGNVDVSSEIRSAVAFVTAGRNVITEFDLDPAPVNGETGQQIVRIVQEAAANAGKHASATRIRTELRRFANSLRIRVEDDGRGFDASEALTTSGGHFGVLGMQERAERINGTFQLRTEPGKGTTIEVVVPLPS